MSWECPERNNVGDGEAHIYKAQKRNVETKMKGEEMKEGISLVMRKVLINP